MMWFGARFSSMQALGWWPPFFPSLNEPFHKASHKTPELLSRRGNVSAPRIEDKVFNLILEVISHHFYWVLFTWSDSQSPPHTLGEKTTKRWRMLSSMLEAVCYKRFHIIFSQYFEDIGSLSSSIVFQTRWLMWTWTLFLCR